VAEAMEGQERPGWRWHLASEPGLDVHGGFKRQTAEAGKMASRRARRATTSPMWRVSRARPRQA